jgi:2-amino-4-hydroxy-6-hydroxymethyldihydropteridine diphosphokinase
MAVCLIGLGANLGDRAETLRRGVELLGQHPRVRSLRTSRWIETQPAGGPDDQDLYLNGAATIETDLPPDALLAVLHDIEHRLGRRREMRWEPRPVDLDLLLYGDLVEESPSLVVPHPRMAWRRFVLEPAREIAPTMRHPVLRRNLQQLLDHLNRSPRYVAVTGLVANENARFTARVADAGVVEALFDADEPILEPIPSSPDPSGHAPVIAIKCLRRRARQLADRLANQAKDRLYVISDFWFDEPRAAVLAQLEPVHLPDSFRRWEHLARRVPPARLVVLLDAPVKEACSQLGYPPGSRCRGAAIALAGEYRDYLRRQLRRSDVGPVLRITDPDSPEAIAEVAAAIQAME